MNNSIFIIGNPRSGTTLLRLILNSHSKISVSPECGFIVWLFEKYGNWCTSDSSDPSRRAQFVADLVSCKKFDTWKLSGSQLDGRIARQCPPDYAALCSLVHSTYAEANSRTVDFWGDKNNFHVNHLDFLNALFPNAYFIHIVRDGRDVACSYREVMASKSKSPYFPNLATDVGSIAAEWSANVLRVAQFLSLIASSRSQTLRYEDLVESPERSIQALCAGLGLAYEPTMKDFYSNNLANQVEPAETMDWKMRTLEPISTKTVGRYQQALSSSELAEFDQFAHAALATFGYQ